VSFVEVDVSGVLIEPASFRIAERDLAADD
jgi:hypothetical protein